MPHDAYDEASRDRALLEKLLLEIEVEGEGGAGVKYPLAQPSLARYRREDYGWDGPFFVQSLVGVGEANAAVQLMDAIAWKVVLAGRLPMVTRWCPRDQTWLWRPRARRDDRRFSQLTQPPLIAQTALHLAHMLGDRYCGTERVERYAAAAQTNIDWLLANRIAPGRSLVSVIDPIETGMDSLASWDQCLQAILPAPGGLLGEVMIHHASAFLTLRYIRMDWNLSRIYANPKSCLIEPVSFNVLVIRELLALGQLWSRLGATQRAIQDQARAQDLLDAFECVAWSPANKTYLPQGRINGTWQPLTTISVDSFYPLLLPELTVDRVEALFSLLVERFRAVRSVPASVGIARRSGLRPRLWGPNQVWANTNMFVRDGLRHHAGRVPADLSSRLSGYADKIDADWLQLKQSYRYREYYDQDGRGGGEGPFFWDCLRRTAFNVA